MALDQKSRSTDDAASGSTPKIEQQDPQHSSRLQRMIVRVRAYHARHADWVREFNTLTHGQCGDGPEGISYRALRNWQAEHHLPVDGMVGPATLALARDLGSHAGSKTGGEHPKQEPAHDTKPAPRHDEHPDPEVKEIVAEEHSTTHEKTPQTATHADTTEAKPLVQTPHAVASAATSPTAAAAGGGHAIHPTEGVRDVSTAELETTAEDKGAKGHAFAHSGAGYRKVYKVGDAQLLVFLPAQGIVPPKVDVFMFFHGMYADFATQKKDNFQDENPAVGADMANAVTASARNVIAILPMQWPSFKGDYKKVVDQTLINIGNDLGAQAPLQLGNVSLSGHSLGGAALGKASQELMNETTDITLQDAGYGGDAFAASFREVRDWLLLGKGPKTLRLITQDVVGRGERNTEKSASGLNAASFKSRIDELHKSKGLSKQLTVTSEAFGQPPKTFVGAFLELRLDIAGPEGKQGSVYVLREHGTHQNALKHFDIRDESMQENIAAGTDAGFGIHDGKQAGQAGQVSLPQSKEHAAPTLDAGKKVDQHTKPADSAPTTSTASATATDKKPEPMAAVALDVADLKKSVEELHDPKVSAAATALAALVELSKQMQTELTKPKQQDLQHEVKATGRTDFLKQIADVHAEVAALTGGADPKKLAAVKGRMFRTIQELSPYHSQYRNVDILESSDKVTHRVKGSTTVITRTCNITSLAMALEGLGKGAHTYQGSHDKVLAVAKVFQPELKKAELVGAGGPGWETMTALRLPDFLELAAIAHFVSGKDAPESVIWPAAQTAWQMIMDQGFLESFAKEFGAQAETRWFRFDATQEKRNKNGSEGPYKESNTLAGSANHSQRGSVDKLIDQRNKIEALKAAGDEKNFKKESEVYKKMELGLHGALEGEGIEKKIPLESYKRAVIDQIGAELDSGAAVETVVTAHYVRVHSLDEDHAVIDDPGSQARAHKKVRWEEARAQGMFARRLVLR